MPEASTEKESASLRVDPVFWKKVKMTALERDMNVSEFVEKGLTEYIAEGRNSSNPVVQKAIVILNRFHNLELVMSSKSLDVGRDEGKLRKDFVTVSELMSNALTNFESALNLKKKSSTGRLVVETAEELVRNFNIALTTGLVIEGPGLISKVEKLMKENERLLKENEQLKATLQNISAAYEEFSAKGR